MGENGILARLAEAIIAGDQPAAQAAAEEALAAGIEPMEVMNKGVMAATEKVGDQFQCGDLYLPELILAADAAKDAMAVIIPRLGAEQQAQARRGKVVLGTVSGDVHDIGKNLVGAVLAANGFEVFDVGIDVPPKKFVEKADEVGATVIALSCLMSNSLLYQKDVVDYLKGSGRRDRYYVIIGGGPVTPAWAAEIGADGYGRDATQAAELCKRLVTAGARPPLAQPLMG
jgi:corrinoid protein of di/trimethylamine methyltransferase